MEHANKYVLQKEIISNDGCSYLMNTREKKSTDKIHKDIVIIVITKYHQYIESSFNLKLFKAKPSF